MNVLTNGWHGQQHNHLIYNPLLHWLSFDTFGYLVLAIDQVTVVL